MTGLAFFSFLANVSSGFGKGDFINPGLQLVNFHPSGFLAFLERALNQGILGKGFDGDLPGYEETLEQQFMLGKNFVHRSRLTNGIIINN